MGERVGSNRAPGWLLALCACLFPLFVGCNVVRPKALVIGIDELRADALERAHTPALDGLAARGAAAGDARAPADHRASWSVLLTGLSPSENDESDGDAIPTVFDRLKAARPLAETGFFTAGSDLGAEPGALLGASRASIDCLLSLHGDAAQDREAADAAVEALAGAGRFAGADVELVLLHLSGRDAADAARGSSRAALEATDALVARLFAALESRPARRGERWLVVVTGTGGARDDGRVPLLLAADGILPHELELDDASLFDVAPTVLTWLDVPRGKLPGLRRVSR